MAVWFCGGQIVVSASRSSPVCSNCSIHSSIASRPLEMNAAPVNARNTVCTVYAVSDVFLHRKDICVPLPCVTRRVNLDGIVCFLPYRTSEPIPLHAIAGLVQPSQLQEVIVLNTPSTLKILTSISSASRRGFCLYKMPVMTRPSTDFPSTARRSLSQSRSSTSPAGFRSDLWVYASSRSSQSTFGSLGGARTLSPTS